MPIFFKLFQFGGPLDLKTYQDLNDHIGNVLTIKGLWKS